ncbi:MAG: hypothetical protein KA756_11740 [Steroidobacteraceae bacterium]|nr:hypothetical protein [Steroidobacteraceae bacterium]
MTNIDLQTFLLRHLSNMPPSSGETASGLAQLIGRQPGSESDRAHAAWIRANLMQMEREGKVKRMDDQYPIVWQVKR